MKKKKKIIKLLVFLFLVLIIALVVTMYRPLKEGKREKVNVSYIASNTLVVDLYDLEYNKVESIVRGSEVKAYDFKEEREGVTYTKIKYNDKVYFINTDNVVKDKQDIVLEKEKFVRTNVNVYESLDSSKLISMVKKGEQLEIIGFDEVDETGAVDKYKIKYNDIEGYVYSKYLVDTKEEADKVYDENGIQEYMAKMGDYLGGGTATDLDYYPYEKPKFEDNVMPEEVRALYLNSAAVAGMDNYIDFVSERTNLSNGSLPI